LVGGVTVDRNVQVQWLAGVAASKGMTVAFADSSSAGKNARKIDFTDEKAVTRFVDEFKSVGPIVMHLDISNESQSRVSVDLTANAQNVSAIDICRRAGAVCVTAKGSLLAELRPNQFPVTWLRGAHGLSRGRKHSFESVMLSLGDDPKLREATYGMLDQMKLTKKSRTGAIVPRIPDALPKVQMLLLANAMRGLKRPILAPDVEPLYQALSRPEKNNARATTPLLVDLDNSVNVFAGIYDASELTKDQQDHNRITADDMVILRELMIGKGHYLAAMDMCRENEVDFNQFLEWRRCTAPPRPQKKTK